jgi:hypothetical protein
MGPKLSRIGEEVQKWDENARRRSTPATVGSEVKRRDRNPASAEENTPPKKA